MKAIEHNDTAYAGTKNWLEADRRIVFAQFVAQLGNLVTPFVSTVSSSSTAVVGAKGASMAADRTQQNSEDEPPFGTHIRETLEAIKDLFGR